MRLSISALMVSTYLLTGCSESEIQLEITAKVFPKDADECVLDVRDRHFKYKTLPNCNVLRALSARFIEPGGLDKTASDRISLIAEKGRAIAWMALAVSASEGPRLSLW